VVLVGVKKVLGVNTPLVGGVDYDDDYDGGDDDVFDQRIYGIWAYIQNIM